MFHKPLFYEVNIQEQNLGNIESSKKGTTSTSSVSLSELLSTNMEMEKKYKEQKEEEEEKKKEKKEEEEVEINKEKQIRKKTENTNLKAISDRYSTCEKRGNEKMKQHKRLSRIIFENMSDEQEMDKLKNDKYIFYKLNNILEDTTTHYIPSLYETHIMGRIVEQTNKDENTTPKKYIHFTNSFFLTKTEIKTKANIKTNVKINMQVYMEVEKIECSEKLIDVFLLITTLFTGILFFKLFKSFKYFMNFIYPF